MIHNIKDTLVKNIIEAFPEAAVRFFIPGADQLFDFTRPIGFLNGELHQKNPDTEDRRNIKDATRLDLLLKAFLKNSPLEYLILLLEVHGYNEWEYPDHVHKNFSRLRDKYNDRVMALVIYTETSRNFKPSRCDYSLLGTWQSFGFTPYVVWNQNETLLENDDNEISLMVLAMLLFMRTEGHKHQDEELLTAKIRLLENLKKRKLPPKAEVNFLTFISLYKSFRDITFKHKFDETIHQFNFKEETMSNLELYAAVEAEYAAQEKEKTTKEDIVKNLLKITRLSLREIADATNVSLSMVKSVKRGLAAN